MHIAHMCAILWTLDIAILILPQQKLFFSFFCPVCKVRMFKYFPFMYATMGALILLQTDLRAQIFKLPRSPRVDSKESIPPAYVATRVGYDNPIPNRFLAPIDCFKIPALLAMQIPFCTNVPIRPMGDRVFVWASSPGL
jgi:hypothetical protein